MYQRYSGSRPVSAAESACEAITGGARWVHEQLSLGLLTMCAWLRTWWLHAVGHCARQLAFVRDEMLVLTLVARDAHTPWYAKLIAALAAGYSFSPLQLIPSFIPVFGLLDDMVVLALGVRLALRLTPPRVLASCRERAAETRLAGREMSRRAALAFGALWAAMAVLSLIVSGALLARIL
jgi:uncharacterized membrane protein YkvA (DUF1232 family)